MTTYPKFDDPMPAFTRAAGAAVTHHDDHGRIIGLAENVLHHGAGGGVDDTAAFQAAINAGHRVHVPTHPTGGNYIIKNKLTVTNTAGLYMTGDFNKGYGSVILCDSFPNTTTDLFELPATGFPQLQLEDLYFDHSTGNPPRDFYRQTVADSQGCNWRNLYVQNFGGYGFNAPVEIVAPRFTNCNFISCGAGGMYFALGNAVGIDHCRMAGNGGTADLEIAGGEGYTIDSPVFDGFAPGAANFSRLKTAGRGVTIINPYVEWTSVSASGTLRDIYFNGATNAALIGGVGQVTPGSFTGAGSLTAVEINNSTNVQLVNVPTADWGGGISPYDLKVIGSTGVIASTSSVAARVSVDVASEPYTEIYSFGRLLRSGQNISPVLSGRRRTAVVLGRSSSRTVVRRT